METNRREFIALTGIGAAALAFGAVKDVHAAGDASGASLGTAEEANLKLIADFCATWDTMDVDKLSAFWDDKVTFRMIEGMQRVEGKPALIEGTKQFLATRKKAHFEVTRAAAIGNIVINERIDHFTRENGEDAFHITGVFLVKGGKILEWQDYTWPQA
jgi:limonene-1,2-epoxide hydrolase